MTRYSARLLLLGVVTPLLMLSTAASVAGQSPQVFDPDATRYMALGDSIAAGFKVSPATDGYPFLLYQEGVFDRMPHTLFNNAAVVGATSRDVLLHQVPQALIPLEIGGFRAQYITLTVGGNDLLSVVRYAVTHPNDPTVPVFAQAALTSYSQNLAGIIGQLSAGLPGVKVFVSNQYTIPDLESLLPGISQLVTAFNTSTAQVVATFPNAYLVDVYGAFLGRRNLLDLERHGLSVTEVHPTSVGQRVIEKAFADVIDAHK